MWLFAALLTPIFHGFANILDNYFVNSIFKRVSTFTFFSTFFNFLFLPIVVLISLPDMLPLSLLPFVLLIGLIDVLYAVPYYKALQEEDTSIITALFSVGDVFVPILAFFLVGERLGVTQYVGFLIIIFSSAMIGIDRKAKFSMSKAFFYMLVVSFLLALETVVYKYLFESVGWSTGFVWSVSASFLIASALLLFRKTREDIKENIGTFRKKFPIFALEEFCTFVGSAAAIFAISRAPVTIVEGIGEMQAIIVVLYALLLGKLFPKLFKEKVDRASLVRKFSLFIAMAIGVFLTLR